MATTIQPAPAVVAPPTGRRWWLAAPALAFLAVRAVGTLLWWGMAVASGKQFDLKAWDGYWYLGIAEHGYLGAAQGMVDAHGDPSPRGVMAFFPGYSLAVRALAFMLGHSYLAAALVISTVAGVVYAYGVARLAARLGGGRRVQLAAVVLAAGAPVSAVYSMAYPEALLMALAAWTLVAVLEHRWWVAAPLVAAAGLVSPMAAPLIPVVMVEAALDIWPRLRSTWGAMVAAIVAPLGMLGYLLWVQVQTGAPWAYFRISHAGWDNGWDFGWETARWAFLTFARGATPFGVATAVGIVGAVWLLVWGWRRLPWQLSAYCLLVLALAFGSGGLVQDRLRLLLSVFPLLLPVASSFAAAGRQRLIVATGLFALAGLWVGGSGLTMWAHSI